MTSGMAELGSKISLISKADIRYEGRLFTVDPQECTIALSSVRSFGTEDRETQYPVPAQGQVYDYILFRGSDIKDIRVVDNVTHPQPLNDPAIMQLSVPPSLGGQRFQNHPVLGPLGPPMGQFPGGYGNIGSMAGLAVGIGTGLGMQRDNRSLSSSKPSELIMGGTASAPSVLSPTVEPLRPVNDHASVLDLIGGSRSTTPASLGSRKSPTNDQGVQAGSSKHDDKKIIKPIQPPSQRNQQRRHSRERRDSRGDGQNQIRSNQQRNQQEFYQRQGGYHSGYHNQQQGQPHHQGYQNNQSNHRNNWVNRGPLRPRGRPRGGYRANQPIQGNNKVKNTLKFENDFDFEQGTTQFEELRIKLGKVKLDEVASSSTKSETNGEGDKRDDSGNETGAGETEQDDEHGIFYDKTKSFFDNISCESAERAKGRSQRTDWRVERKLNSETFGVASTRRGPFRGRGGFRGMNYRGGYRSNYRQSQRREPQQPQQSAAPQQQQQQGNIGNNNTEQNQQTVRKDLTAPLSETPQIESETSSNDHQSKSENETIPEPAMAVK